ncbi:hypothetical protein FBZ90_102159 [Nitrospirillum pindoramense]|uniref:Uncharacterized protein n=1 Tax=Nitrospirillum amazonense TaxID=28077 RepID=A0A560HIF4_9PROT|nr:hypothetical protein FBZ90_102159 [Nitrospirillum amazonense]
MSPPRKTGFPPAAPFAYGPAAPGPARAQSPYRSGDGQ